MATFKSDIEIAQECKMLPICDVAAAAGISEDLLEYYGKYKAKLDITALKDRPAKGKLILVTAINPTPAGEGKTTTSVGLADGLRKLGKNAMLALREPSLGPVFGVKGVLPAAVMLRWCRWKTSICTLPEILMPSARRITCWRPCWTTIFSRAMRWGLM